VSEAVIDGGEEGAEVVADELVQGGPLGPAALIGVTGSTLERSGVDGGGRGHAGSSGPWCWQLLYG
jgi:hypothetical protein